MNLNKPFDQITIAKEELVQRRAMIFPNCTSFSLVGRRLFFFKVLVRSFSAFLHLLLKKKAKTALQFVKHRIDQNTLQGRHVVCFDLPLTGTAGHY